LSAQPQTNELLFELSSSTLTDSCLVFLAYLQSRIYVKKLTVLCTCPYSETELINFVRELASFVTITNEFTVRLLLVDNLEVSQVYSEKVVSVLSALPFAVKLETILGVKQFYAMFEAALK